MGGVEDLRGKADVLDWVWVWVVVDDMMEMLVKMWRNMKMTGKRNRQTSLNTLYILRPWVRSRTLRRGSSDLQAESIDNQK